jgi:hypothetical protein
MFDLPDPVGMFEKAKNAGLEREIALDAISDVWSSFLNLLYGCRKIPIIGQGLENQAYGTLASIMNNRLFKEGKLRITVNKELWDPNRLTQFQGEWFDKSSVKEKK